MADQPQPTSHEENANETPPSSVQNRASAKARLPKLVLRKVNGEITNFKSFWDGFDSAVNKNADLSPED